MVQMTNIHVAQKWVLAGAIQCVSSYIRKEESEGSEEEKKRKKRRGGGGLGHERQPCLALKMCPTCSITSADNNNTITRN